MPTRLPELRPPTHPGEFLLKEFLEPLGISQAEAARRLGVSFQRLTELVHGKRGITPDTALRLERFLGQEATWWLAAQHHYDLWRLLHGPEAAAIAEVQPFARKA